MSITLLDEMPDRLTETDGRWYLRHAVTNGGHHVFVVSERAPARSRSYDLRPLQLEIMPDDWDGDKFVLSISDIKELIAWPPERS